MSSSARNLFKILSSFLIQKNPHHEEVCVHEETTAGLWAPLPDSHVVLFLDFDGVCHRCKNETFERMPLLEKLLDNCPAMVIVISSSWRECANTSYLKSLFRVPYRDKIIGATGSVYLKHGQTGVRAAECEDFVFSHRVKAFICLNDDESLFPAGYPHLHKTDYYTGLTESDLAALNASYHQLMGR
ncbi:TPA: hypothetical protein SCR33_003491 [Enterobacter kobei]|nr:hypothetical protein [Enterobacter kobei]